MGVEYIQPRSVTTAVPKNSPKNLLAMGNVVSERVVTIEELASRDRYAAVEATQVAAPREIVTVQAAPTVEYVQAAPAVEYIQPAPTVEYVQAAPAVEYVQQAPIVEYVQ